MKQMPWLLLLVPTLWLSACGQPHAGAADADRTGGPPQVSRSAPRGVAKGMLTKEEVGAVLGKPVTSVEGRDTNLTYRTDVIQLDTDIEVEEKDDADDAVQAMQGARTATGLLGGKPEPIAGMGDEAMFGAMSILYVRKGAVVISIRPPNLQGVAGMTAYEKVRDAKMGSDEQRAAMDNFLKVEKTDPLQVAAGPQGDRGIPGAIATINAVSAKQGTDYEKQARAMARALAVKVLQKL